MHPCHIQVRTEDGLLHVFECHGIVRLDVQGFPGYLERQDVPNNTRLDISNVYVPGVRVVVATYASGFVELRGATAVEFLRLFYQAVHSVRRFQEPEEPQGDEQESSAA